MSYNGLTNKGLEYLTKCQAESKAPVFTRVKIGSGSIGGGQTGEETTDVYKFEKEVEILAKQQVNNLLKLEILIDNTDVESGFYVKEIGIYVEDEGEELLYWYINRDRPSFMEDKTNPTTQRYILNLEVTQAEAVVINFDGKDLLVDKEFVLKSLKPFEDRLSRIEKYLNLEFRESTLGNGYLGDFYIG